LTSQKKFLLTSQTACLHRCAATGLSLDWSKFFSTEWSIPMSLVADLSIDWSKLFFFHQSKPMVNMLFECVAPVLSIDNSKNIFFGQSIFCLLFGVVVVLGVEDGGWGFIWLCFRVFCLFRSS